MSHPAKLSGGGTEEGVFCNDGYVDPVKRLKKLEAENARLKRAVADLTVDKLILKEVAERKC